MLARIELQVQKVRELKPFGWVLPKASDVNAFSQITTHINKQTTDRFGLIMQTSSVQCVFMEAENRSRLIIITENKKHSNLEQGTGNEP